MAVCPYAARFQDIAIELSGLIMPVHHCYPKILALYNVRGADMIIRLSKAFTKNLKLMLYVSKFKQIVPKTV